MGARDAPRSSKWLGKGKIVPIPYLSVFKDSFQAHVECIIELVMIRDNTLQLSSDVFSLMDIRGRHFFFYVLVSLV